MRTVRSLAQKTWLQTIKACTRAVGGRGNGNDAKDIMEIK